MPSTTIADIHYNRDNERLMVTLVTGRTYEYVDVPPEVAASFQSAFSKGVFFNDYIRDRIRFPGDRARALAESFRTVRRRIAKRRFTGHHQRDHVSCGGT